MNTVTLKIDSDTLKQMESFYEAVRIPVHKDYILWKCTTPNGVNLTIYASKKGFKALFSGPEALEEARRWNPDAAFNAVKEKKPSFWLYEGDQIGSDEVGTGDFFGPVIVVASFIRASDIAWLREERIDDSKKMTDRRITELVPLLLNRIVFSKLTCPNEKYNELVGRGYSLNKIKAILHNHALLKVREKIGKADMPCFVDQFAEPDLYYFYLQNEPEVLNRNIVFKTKGESFYPSVALSSMIARYGFLKEIEKIEEKYGMSIPKGASEKVDRVALTFAGKYGLNELKKNIKINFSNFSRLKEQFPEK